MVIEASVKHGMYTAFKRLAPQWKRFIFIVVDLVLIVVALFFSFSLLENILLPIRAATENWALFLLLTGVAIPVSTGLGIPGIKLNAYEIRAVFRTGLFAMIITAVGATVTRIIGDDFASPVFVVFGFLFFGLSVASRLVGLQWLLYIYSKSPDRARVLVYGAGATGVQLVAAIGRSEDIEPVAFVDDNKTLQTMIVAGLPVYPPSKIRQLVIDKKIDRVVLAMPSLSLPRQARIARRLAKLGCAVHRLPSFSELVGIHDLVDNLEPVQPSHYLGRGPLDSDLPGVAQTYENKVVLISGAGGTIGSELCRQLLSCHPAGLILFEQSEIALYAIHHDLLSLAEDTDVQIIPVLGSVCDRIAVRRVFKSYKIDAVLHAAAYKHVPMVEINKVEGLRNNVLGTKVLAEAARHFKVERFVLVSSDKAVRPSNVMGASKRLAELVVQDFASRPAKTLFSMVRFGNVLGSSGSVIPLFQEQIARGGPITLTDPDVTRFFMTIPEASRLVLLAGSFAKGGDVFVLDMGKQVFIKDLAAQMIERAGYSVRSCENPNGDIEIIVTGLRPGEKLKEELLIGEGLQTTPHPKITRAQEQMLSEIEVANMLRDLNRVVESSNAEAAMILINRWVEGYQKPRHVGIGRFWEIGNHFQNPVSRPIASLQ